MVFVDDTVMAMLDWIADHGLRTIGYTRESYLACPDDRVAWVTEIQLPATKDTSPGTAAADLAHPSTRLLIGPSATGSESSSFSSGWHGHGFGHRRASGKRHQTLAWRRRDAPSPFATAGW